MARHVNPELIRLAIGENEKLPSAEYFAKVLADAELKILLNDPEVPDDLISVGWYLHGIASSKFAINKYGIERVRAAFQVSANVFDLILRIPGLSDFDKLVYCFASQVSYLKSTLDPNSIAVYRREFISGLPKCSFPEEFQIMALSCGIALLGFDPKYIYDVTEDLDDLIEEKTRLWDIQDIDDTIFGSAAKVALATHNLMGFLLYGNNSNFDKARNLLLKALDPNTSREDQYSRWVAAHLLSISDYFNETSIWKNLPPQVPDGVKKAFTHGSPQVLIFWPPQREILFKNWNENLLSENLKRAFLSTPTSGGKTLIAQLLILNHLATKRTSVCYVAPTRSLCREVRNSLQGRLRFISRKIISNLPEGDWFDYLFEDIDPDVEVMTPERLSFLLRTDSEKLMSKFGLFIFDEVHHLGDDNRGWTLEEDISLLNHLTKNSKHKIVLISAGVGNRNHFLSWFENGDMDPKIFHSDWQGPKRIYAIWTTEAEWDCEKEETNPKARKYLYVKKVPLKGRLDIRISHTAEFRTLFTKSHIGYLVRKSEEKFYGYTKDNQKSTTNREILSKLIEYISQFGPLLIVESTKLRAINLALEISKNMEQSTKRLNILKNIVEKKLGTNHPLNQVIDKGVVFHHGSLPHDVRIVIEESISRGDIDITVSTTSLTEGINLPFTSVVIASQGSYSSGGYNEYITGSKLINAIGRAGRAAKETNGIIVLARDKPFRPDDFKRLIPDERDLVITSMLARSEALDQLAAFEEMSNKVVDAIFEFQGEHVSNFVKFVWLINSILERNSIALEFDHIKEVIGNSFGWVQLEDVDKERWLKVAEIVLGRYLKTAEPKRKRWASSGVSIESSRQLDEISIEVFNEVHSDGIPLDIIGCVDLITRNNRLNRIVSLSDLNFSKINMSRSGRKDNIDIPHKEILFDWIKGVSLVELAEKYLYVIDDESFRMEQIVDYVHSYFEVFLPWIFGTIISWVDKLLKEADLNQSFPENIPAYIRYGISSSQALKLCVLGVDSRSLAVKVADLWLYEKPSESIIQWLRLLEVNNWISKFDVSNTEIHYLLDVVREMDRNIISILFSKNQVAFAVNSLIKKHSIVEVVLKSEEKSEVPRIGIWHDDKMFGVIKCKNYRDISNLLKTDVLLNCRFFASKEQGTLILSLKEFS